MKQPSPLPWYASGDAIVSRKRPKVVPDDFVAFMQKGENGEEVANQELIVRAVNAHDELVKLLHASTEALQVAHDTHIYSDDDDHDEAECSYCDIMNENRAALRKAQGGKV